MRGISKDFQGCLNSVSYLYVFLGELDLDFVGVLCFFFQKLMKLCFVLFSNVSQNYNTKMLPLFAVLWELCILGEIADDTM